MSKHKRDLIKSIIATSEHIALFSGEGLKSDLENRRAFVDAVNFVLKNYNLTSADDINPDTTRRVLNHLEYNKHLVETPSDNVGYSKVQNILMEFLTLHLTPEPQEKKLTHQNSLKVLPTTTAVKRQTLKRNASYAQEATTQTDTSSTPPL